MIREAEFRDCKRITDFLARMHEEKGYQAKFSPERVRNTVQVASQNRKLHNVWIVEVEGKVEGVLIGVTNRIWYSNEREAFDLVYVVSEAGRGYGGYLLRRFNSWWQGETTAKEAYISEALGRDARLEQMLERLGYQYVGNMYRQRVAT